MVSRCQWVIAYAHAEEDAAAEGYDAVVNAGDVNHYEPTVFDVMNRDVYVERRRNGVGG